MTKIIKIIRGDENKAWYNKKIGCRYEVKEHRTRKTHYSIVFAKGFDQFLIVPKKLCEDVK